MCNFVIWLNLKYGDHQSGDPHLLTRNKNDYTMIDREFYIYNLSEQITKEYSPSLPRRGFILFLY